MNPYFRHTSTICRGSSSNFRRKAKRQLNLVLFPNPYQILIPNRSSLTLGFPTSRRSMACATDHASRWCLSQGIECWSMASTWVLSWGKENGIGFGGALLSRSWCSKFTVFLWKQSVTSFQWPLDCFARKSCKVARPSSSRLRTLCLMSTRSTGKLSGPSKHILISRQASSPPSSLSSEKL